MATLDECRQALGHIAKRSTAGPEGTGRVDFERSVSCHIRDLDHYFHGRMHGAEITDIADGDDPKAQIKLALSGDDLLALAAGELRVASAWAAGRVSVKASMTDLLKLRKLL